MKRISLKIPLLFPSSSEKGDLPLGNLFCLTGFTLTLRGRENRRKQWVRASSIQIHPLIRPTGHLLPKGEDFPLFFLNVDSATPGKPCVQNDL